MAREFDVQVMRGAAKIGMEVTVARDLKAVIVGTIKEGAVQRFNLDAVAAGEKHDIIKRGDRIVEVDGCGRGNAGEITTALKSASTIVHLRLERLLEFSVVDLPYVPREASGFSFANGPAGELMLAGLGLAANKFLQPDVELRAGDWIVKVNGRSGTPAELKSEMNASEIVSLLVRRGGADSF